QLGQAQLVGYEKANIISVEELAPHGYDDGSLTQDRNGLIYTCRGGFIDTAHVRDHADITLYLAMRLAGGLPYKNTLELAEKVSAFSPEDLYSNVLGMRLALGIINNRENRSREFYDRTLDAWFAEALRRLGAVSREQGRRAMQAVDGLWWDSTRLVP